VPSRSRFQMGLPVAALIAATLSLQSASALAAKPSCSLSTRQRAAAAKALKPPVTLSVESQSDPVLNFDSGRGTKFDYITLKASPPLPARIHPKNIELDSLAPMKRIGTDNLESTRLKFPSFTRPWIHSHGERVTFAICVSAASGDPGTYTGQVEVSGPVGLAPFQLSQTAQLKAPVMGLFGLLFLIALFVAGVFIWRKVGEENHADKPQKIGAQALVVLIALGAAAYSMWRIYDQSPAWGADWFTSFAALVAAGFAAGGLGAAVTAASGFIAGSDKAGSANHETETKAPEKPEPPPTPEAAAVPKRS
jgi:hypothetical protein